VLNKDPSGGSQSTVPVTVVPTAEESGTFNRWTAATTDGFVEAELVGEAHRSFTRVTAACTSPVTALGSNDLIDITRLKAIKDAIEISTHQDLQEAQFQHQSKA